MSLSQHAQSRAEPFDLWLEVPLVPQLTGMSCWAAAAAMIIGWRDCIDIDPEDVARASGRWSDYRDGMHPHDIDSFARAWGLFVEPAGSLTVTRLRELLERNGPLWVGEASAGLHVIVMAGIYGDGTPDGTLVRVLDPWPEGRGERYTLSASELLRNLRATVEISGEQPRILHTGGRGCGLGAEARNAKAAAASTSDRGREERRSFVSFDQATYEEGYGRPRYGTPYGVLRQYARSRRTTPERVSPLAQSSDEQTQRADARDAPVDDTDWYTDADLAGDPSGQALLARADAAWADDADSPDFRHLNHAGSSIEFDLGGVQLAELFRLNGFDVSDGQDEVLFGLRGCRMAEGAVGGQFADAVRLSEDLPDHVGYHCVMGVFRRGTNQLAVFPGSTVPNWALMERQRATGSRGKIANLLPTGSYSYHIGQHRAVTGAFVLQPDVVVLRSLDDLVYQVTDVWEEHSPGDNIHPGFSGQQALFSSAGCQTVPGRWTAANGHQGTWADFRAAAGLGADDRSGWGRKYTYCLLTGRDARMMSDGASGHELARLRFGSSGAVVSSLQTQLAAAGLLTGTIDGRVGARTALAVVRWQQQRDGGRADGIVTPALAGELGVSVL
jgi:Papain-like cysteine protease AvrRpt2/Putative peptidoglycan binding domain